MIQAKAISKTFDGNQVLRSVDVDLLPGKVNFIIGRSGSGKSVLTKCLVGLLEVDEGSILYDNRDFSSMTVRQRIEIRKDIGMLFQSAALFDSLTVEENVIFPLKMFTKQSKAEMVERANWCLQRVNLEGKNNLYPSELSGGMQKRTGIARAIALNPKYLFCDEPNSGLDPQTAILIDNLIREITYEFGTTTVVVSHDMNSVIEIGDRVHFINQGMIWWKGTKQEILTTDNREFNDFVFPSEFMKKIRENLRENR